MHFYVPRTAESAILRLRRLIIGSCCVFCNRKSGVDRDICCSCEQLLMPRIVRKSRNRVNYLCGLCGDEQTEYCSPQEFHDISNGQALSAQGFFCQQCQNTNTLFVRLLAPYRYEFPLDSIIKKLKYGKQRLLGRVLGSLLASFAKTQADLPQMIVAVPMHPSRQLGRGYNQADDIARWCAKDLGIPYRSRAASRIFDTGSMAGLSKSARQLRILGAFSAAEEVNGKRVAIVDDVLTTGATARELARELYDTGALSVELWVLARTSSAR